MSYRYVRTQSLLSSLFFLFCFFGSREVSGSLVSFFFKRKICINPLPIPSPQFNFFCFLSTTLNSPPFYLFSLLSPSRSTSFTEGFYTGIYIIIDEWMNERTNIFVVAPGSPSSFLPSFPSFLPTHIKNRFFFVFYHFFLLPLLFPLTKFFRYIFFPITKRGNYFITHLPPPPPTPSSSF